MPYVYHFRPAGACDLIENARRLLNGKYSTFSLIGHLKRKQKEVFNMEAFGVLGFVFGMMGLIAFVRLEKLTKTLKKKGILEEDYKDE